MIDERTQKYFDTIRKNLGYHGHNAGWYGIEEILKKKGVYEQSNLQKIKSYGGYINGDINLYKYLNDGKVRYCAEVAYQTAIDDYCIETHIFDRYPSEDDIWTIRKINSIEFNMNFNRMKPEFNCYECGTKVHWLDNDYNFKYKVQMLEDKYCGC